MCWYGAGQLIPSPPAQMPSPEITQTSSGAIAVICVIHCFENAGMASHPTVVRSHRLSRLLNYNLLFLLEAISDHYGAISLDHAAPSKYSTLLWPRWYESSIGIADEP